jgi:hypothetical protein
MFLLFVTFIGAADVKQQAQHVPLLRRRVSAIAGGIQQG